MVTECINGHGRGRELGVREIAVPVAIIGSPRPGENAMSTTAKQLKDVLTTGEVAKICNVAPRTVSKWFDSGALTGYRIPGSKDRRIPLNQLIQIGRAHV